ncbi:MAG TPA: nitronate monooxygenase [Xanthobacteraceae bacterium]|nr:nitronate monooxygenase [Xanthobacteraceae bacterium]
MWPDRRLLDLFRIEYPIVQAPMAGAMDGALAAAVSKAGGLGSLPCAMLSVESIRAEMAKIRESTRKPVNLNFFCHRAPVPNNAREAVWREKLAPYYHEFGIDPSTAVAFANRKPFDESTLEVVRELRPEVVSFHFGLPEPRLFEGLKREGVIVISSATTVDEARWLDERGVDAVIAQGFEAGGHRGMFLAEDVGTQVGTLALVPQIVDAVELPVIAAGGIADARGIAAAFALGAAGVQIGSAYLRCPEAKISAPHREAIQSARDDSTVLTNVMTGRPARGFITRVVREMGPIDQAAPEFPLAAAAIQPLRAKAEAQGSGDFSPLWAGQAVALGRDLPAAEVTQRLAAETEAYFRKLGQL